MVTGEDPSALRRELDEANEVIVLLNEGMAAMDATCKWWSNTCKWWSDEYTRTLAQLVDAERKLAEVRANVIALTAERIDLVRERDTWRAIHEQFKEIHAEEKP